MFEKIFCDKFVIPLVRDRVDPNQFADVPGPGKGTTVALTTMYLHLLRFLDDMSGAVTVAAVDLSYFHIINFDTLTHTSIINACIKIHLPKDVVRWILSYL